MSTSWSLSAIKTKVRNDLDLQDEVFVTDAELTELVNDAITEAEHEIHAINKDYFLTSEYLPLVNGTSEYSLPSGIYANKIRGIIYKNGATVIPIKRIRGETAFEEIARIQAANNGDPAYLYQLRNDDSGGVQIELFPAAKETSSQNVVVWYWRSATRLSSASDVCDIPEGILFIFAHIKKSVLTKELGGVCPQEALIELERQKKLMIDSLSQRVPDDDDTIVADYSHYYDHN